MNYDDIKRMAKDIGCRVGDLVALSPNNDPFYVGTESDKTLARWFKGLWDEYGYDYGVHIRRVHYQLVSQSPPPMMPNGDPYHNTEKCWGFISEAAKAARYLGLVDPGAFVDRRNPDPHIYSNPPAEPSINVDTYGFSDVTLPQFPDMPRYTIYDYDTIQPINIEIWCEKSTMNDILLPICQGRSVNLVTGLGELSLTATLNAVKRIEDVGKPTRILYISDFDPAGQTMPVSVSRKLEYFIKDRGLDQDIQLIPIMLTQEQIQQYHLPRIPIKETERRKARFELEFGTGAVELDALEALHPGVLRRLVRSWVAKFQDENLESNTEESRTDLVNELRSTRNEVIASHKDELDDLRKEYNVLKEEYEDRIINLSGRITDIYNIISEEMQDAMPDIQNHLQPEGDITYYHPDPLFDSSRGYVDQMQSYKKFQGGDKFTRFSAIQDDIDCDGID